MNQAAIARNSDPLTSHLAAAAASVCEVTNG
jgi:hypothetical protein